MKQWLSLLSVIGTILFTATPTVLKAETSTIAILRIDDLHYQVNIQNYNRPYRLAVMDGLSPQFIDLIESDYGSKNIQTVVTLPRHFVHPRFEFLDYDTGKEIFGITK